MALAHRAWGSRNSGSKHANLAARICLSRVLRFAGAREYSESVLFRPSLGKSEVSPPLGTLLPLMSKHSLRRGSLKKENIQINSHREHQDVVDRENMNNDKNKF